MATSSPARLSVDVELASVLKFFSVRELGLSAAAVSKQWKRMADSPQVWAAHVAKAEREFASALNAASTSLAWQRCHEPEKHAAFWNSKMMLRHMPIMFFVHNKGGAPVVTPADWDPIVERLKLCGNVRALGAIPDVPAKLLQEIAAAPGLKKLAELSLATYGASWPVMQQLFLPLPHLRSAKFDFNGSIAAAHQLDIASFSRAQALRSVTLHFPFSAASAASAAASKQSGVLTCADLLALAAAPSLDTLNLLNVAMQGRSNFSALGEFAAHKSASRYLHLRFLRFGLVLVGAPSNAQEELLKKEPSAADRAHLQAFLERCTPRLEVVRFDAGPFRPWLDIMHAVVTAESLPCFRELRLGAFKVHPRDWDVTPAQIRTHFLERFPARVKLGLQRRLVDEFIGQDRLRIGTVLQE